MNRFGSPRDARPRVWLEDVHAGGSLKRLSEGQLMGTIVHSLCITRRRSIGLGYRTEDDRDPHLSRLTRFVRILEAAGFEVTKRYATPRDGYTPGNPYKVEYRVRLRDDDELEALMALPFRVDREEEFLSALLRAFLTFSVLGREQWEVRLSKNAEVSGLRWIGQLAGALGAHLRQAEYLEDSLSLRFDYSPPMDLRWPMDEFVQANQWRILTYYLNKVVGRGCEICNRAAIPRVFQYDVGWCPLYRTDGSYGQLVALRGFTAAELKEKALELAGSAISGVEGSALFVPIEKWGPKEFRGKPISFPNTDWRRLRILSRIPRPPSLRGKTIERTKEAGAGRIPIALIPLGGGQEIGANSYLLKIGTFNVLLDCGLDIGEENHNPLGLPRLEKIDHLEAIILSHAHTDHIGSILMAHTLFPGTPIVCTPETAALMRIQILHHSSEKFKRRQSDELGVQLPPTREWDMSFEKSIVEVGFGVEWPLIPGVAVRLLSAGHILGASHVELRVGNRRILYTGDFCLRDQLTVNGSKILDEEGWDTIITESTYGASSRPVALDVGAVVSEVGELLDHTVRNRSLAVLPAFSLGKAQEVYALVETARQRKWSSLPRNRILIGGLAAQFFPAYAQFPSNSNFKFTEATAELPDIDPEDPTSTLRHLTGEGAAIVIATHGMLVPETLSHTLAMAVIGNPNASILLTGYQAPNSLGAAFLECRGAPGEDGRSLIHRSLPNDEIRVRAGIYDLHISGHATISELRQLFTKHKPGFVVVVHGDAPAAIALANEVAVLLPSASIFAPVNLERVELGQAAISAEDILKWKGIARVHPSPPPIQVWKPPRKKKNSVLKFLKIRSGSEDSYPEADRASEKPRTRVWLRPNSLYARLNLEPPAWFPFQQFDRVEIFRVEGHDRKTHLLRDSYQLDALPRNQITASLLPGLYELEAEFPGGLLKQEIEVILDLRESAEEWLFDSNGKMDVSIPMIETHLEAFDSVRLVVPEGEPADGLTWRATPTGTALRLQLQQIGRVPKGASLQFRFFNSYPTVHVNLHPDRAQPRDAILAVPEQAVMVGEHFDLRCEDRNYEISELELVSGPPFNTLFQDEKCVKIQFTEPGESRMSVLVARRDGAYFTLKRTIEVLSPLKVQTSRAAELPVDTDVEVTGTLAAPAAWKEFEVRVDGVLGKAALAGEDLTLRFHSSSQVGAMEVLVRAATSTGDAHCLLLRETFRVGLGDEIDFEESRLFVDEAPALLVLRNQSGFDTARIRTLESALQAWSAKAQAFDDKHEIRIELRWPDTEAHIAILPIPYAGLRILDARKLSVLLSQRGSAVTDIAGAADEIRIQARPINIPRLSGQESTFLAVLRLSQVLEWEELSDDNRGGLVLDPLRPGDYVVVIRHYGRTAFEKRFSVEERRKRSRTRAVAGAAVNREMPAEEFEPFLRGFLESSNGVPPAIVGVGKDGARYVINASDQAGILARFVQESVAKGVLIFVTPRNEIPAVLSKALFDGGTRWAALSWPCARNTKPVSADDFLLDVSSTPVETRHKTLHRRRIPSAEVGRWEPEISIACPKCSKGLRVDLEAKPPNTACDCGFETQQVRYTLEDLKKEGVRILVVQYRMFGYLVEHARVRFGARLGGTLHCSKCEYWTPFRNEKDLRDIVQRFQVAESRRLPGELAYFVSEGWWYRTPKGMVVAPKLEAIRHGHCPVCCSDDLDLDRCPKHRIVRGMGRTVILLIGLQDLGIGEPDEHDLVDDPFPEHLYPGLEGPEDSLVKVGRMLRAVDAWWEGE